MKHAITRPMSELPSTDDSFVHRWSRLKRQSPEEPSTSQSTQPQQVDGDSGKVLTDDDMPDIETLTPDSDYTGFLSNEVSESLRRLALRKLFQGAEFNVRDGLDDYDQDFTSFTKLAGVITADMKHRLALELERASEREAEEKAEQAKTADQKESGDGIDEKMQEPVRGPEPAAADKKISKATESDELASIAGSSFNGAGALSGMPDKGKSS